MQPRTEKLHSSYLFPAVVSVLVAQPVLATVSATATEFLVPPLTVTLVAGIWSLDRSRVWTRVSLAVGVAMLAIAVANALRPNPALLLAGIGCLVVLGTLSVILGIRWLFVSSRITIETLLSAMSVYLMIGITFGMTYVGLYLGEPGWYHGVSPGGRSAEIAELVYFSLGVLTTVAFGDVLPVHPVSRLLCNIEAVIGQMYVAVLVAKLVSGYASGRMDTGPGDGHTAQPESRGASRREIGGT